MLVKVFFALVYRCFDILMVQYLALSGSGWPGSRIEKRQAGAELGQAQP